MTWLGLVAQSEPSGGGIEDLIRYGVLGTVIVALLTGWLWTKPAVEQLKRDKDAADARAVRAEEQRDKLAVELQSALPVLTETTTACRRMLPLLQELIDDRPPRGEWRRPDPSSGR